MSRLRIPPALALAALLLAGCGFQPLYRSGGAGQVPEALGKVSIAPIPDRMGRELRNELLSRINPGGSPNEPSHRLSVELNEEQQGILVERDNFVSRVNLRIRAKFVLVDLASEKPVLEGQARTVAAYNVTSAQYANLVAETDAKRRAALVVAEQITDRLAAYFSRKGGA